MIPSIKLVAYEDQQFVFVAVPNERNRYLRTDKAVVQAACPFCKSRIGEPCTSTYGGGLRKYVGYTHTQRRHIATWPRLRERPNFKPKRWPDDGEVRDEFRREVCLSGLNPAACPDRPECRCNESDRPIPPAGLRDEWITLKDGSRIKSPPRKP